MKKNWNVAKIFTLLITVLFLASTLFVGCKEPEPTEPTKYMVTYVTNPEGLQVENFPTNGEVEENTTIELPVLTLEGYTFDGWYDGDTKVDSPYKVTKAVTLTAKFTENVAPSLPAGGEEGGTTPPAGGEEGGTTPPAGGEEGGTTPPAGGEEGGTTPPAGGEEGSTTPPAGGEEGSTTPEPKPTPDTTNNFKGNYYAGEGDMGYIEFTNDTDCVVFVVSAVPATYTVADNVATIKGVEDYSVIEIKTTALANDSFSVTYPVEICKRFDSDASKDMVITYTKADKPSSEGGEGGVIPDPEPTGTTYTIPEIDPSWTNIVVWAWSDNMPDGISGYVVQAVNTDGTVTFETTEVISNAKVILLKDDVDSNTTDSSNIWDNKKEGDSESQNYVLGENNIFELPPIVLKEVYLNPGVWDTASAWFAVNYWGDNGSGWIKMVLEDEYYKCEIPEGSNIIFCRMDTAKSDLSWDSKWNQSEDLILNNDNLYSISGWGNEKSPGSWSTYTPE